MRNRRNFFKLIYGFFIFLFVFKSRNITSKVVMPLHHLDNGTFKNPPGIILKQISSIDGKRFNFIKFFYRGIIKKEMFDRKEIPDDIPLNHSISQNEAINKFRQAIDLDKEYAEAYFNIGNLLHNLGNFNEAETYLKSAINSNPNYIKAIFILGENYYLQGKFEFAIKNYLKILDIQNNHQDSFIRVLDLSSSSIACASLFSG